MKLLLLIALAIYLLEVYALPYEEYNAGPVEVITSRTISGLKCSMPQLPRDQISRVQVVNDTLFIICYDDDVISEFFLTKCIKDQWVPSIDRDICKNNSKDKVKFKKVFKRNVGKFESLKRQERIQRKIQNGILKTEIEHNTPTHVRVHPGHRAFLLCRVRNLGTSSIMWAFNRQVLSIDTMQITSNPRFRSSYDANTYTWTLELQDIRLSDAGIYLCQVNSKPRLQHKVSLQVIPHGKPLLPPVNTKTKKNEDMFNIKSNISALWDALKTLKQIVDVHVNSDGADHHHHYDPHHKIDTDQEDQSGQNVPHHDDVSHSHDDHYSHGDDGHYHGDDHHHHGEEEDHHHHEGENDHHHEGENDHHHEGENDHHHEDQDHHHGEDEGHHHHEDEHQHHEDEHHHHEDEHQHHEDEHHHHEDEHHHHEDEHHHHEDEHHHHEDEHHHHEDEHHHHEDEHHHHEDEHHHHEDEHHHHEDEHHHHEDEHHNHEDEHHHHEDEHHQHGDESQESNGSNNDNNSSEAGTQENPMKEPKKMCKMCTMMKKKMSPKKELSKETHHHHHHYSSKRNRSEYLNAFCILKPNVETEDSLVKVEGLIEIYKRIDGEGPLYFDYKHVKNINQEADKSLRLGFHLHEHKVTDNNCSSAGPHYNPSSGEHGAPDSPTKHLGDLGNIDLTKNSNEEFIKTDSNLQLEGQYSIVKRSIVVHEAEDEFEPAKTGGRRIACCTININRAKVTIRFNG